MGLDMYAAAVKLDTDKQVDFEFSYDTKGKELAYWRKFNHLHGWMHSLYKDKGGESESFNCNKVRLMPEDLDRLEKDLETGLKPTAGFFFGGSEIYPEDIEKTKKFIKDARKAIKNGKVVFYDSWW